MLKLIFYYSFSFLFLWSFSDQNLIAKATDRSAKSKSIDSFNTDAREQTACNISNLSYWIKKTALSSVPSSIYPSLTEWVVYADGLFWGGYVRDLIDTAEVALRVGGQEFLSGTTSGWIEQAGDGVNPAVRIDPAHPRARLYRILRGWENLTPDMAAVIRDAAILDHIDLSEVTTERAQEVIDQYAQDWNEWPVDLGAPLIDVNSNGIWDQKEGLADADQIIWFVINDLDTTLARAFFGSPPIGLEVQITIWAYNQPDATLGQTVFKRFRIINKSGFQIDSMFVAQWVDPDLGQFSDDLVGCDIERSLGFVYNGNLNDRGFEIYNLPPPAVGYDFFQGPIVYTGNPEDSAIFDFNYRSGFKNLPMTSFGYYSQGSGIDDPEGNYTGTLQWYNMLNGFLPTDDLENPSPYIVGAGPDRGQTTKFPLSGDPFLQTGDIDAFGDNFAPGDRRFHLCSGPFDMAPGDTQEVVVALIGGIIPETGGNNRNAVAQLKLNDDFAQFLYDNLFQGIPKPPAPAPVVKFTELTDKVILNWGSDPNIYTETEKNDPILGFNFEGYNVYQLPGKNATKSQAKLVKTFDKVNFITTIRAKKFLPEFGDIVTVPIQRGTDSGIQRYFVIEKDYINDQQLYPGSKYYFAVTAYNYNADPNVPEPSLESALNVIEVIPQPTKPGTVYQGSFGTQLEVTQGGGEVDGMSDGIVAVFIIDPAAITGHEYEVFFKVDDDTNSTTFGETLWNVRDKTNSYKEVLADFQEQVDDVDAIKTQPIFDGIQVKVSGPAPGMKDWDIPQGTRRFTWSEANFGFEGFNGAIGWGSPYGVFGGNPEPIPASGLKNVLLILAQVTNADKNYNPTFDDPNDPNISYAYRYGRNFASPPQYPEFAPFIVNPSGGFAFQDFTGGVPLSAWDVDDPDNPRRLAVGFLENNQPGDTLGKEGGLVDGKWWPSDASMNNVAGSGPREWLWIFDTDYSEIPNPDFQVEATGNPLPIMYWLTVNRRGAIPFSPGGTGEDHFLILGSKINTTDDIFTFTAPAVVVSDAQAKVDVENIKVFPNPYYAYHSQETNRNEKFVTFTHLPERATIRIFNLAGRQVRKLEKIPGDGTGQFFKWDLNNESGLPVAGGFYIAYIDMPDLNKTKVVKFFILQRVGL